MLIALGKISLTSVEVFYVIWEEATLGKTLLIGRMEHTYLTTEVLHLVDKWTP